MRKNSNELGQNVLKIMKAMVAHTKSHPLLGIRIENNRVPELEALILQHDRKTEWRGGQQKTDPACFLSL